jgi:hypothetical protein
VRAAFPGQAAGRHELAPGVIGCDSIGEVREEDAGRILVIGSHASLHGGRPESALGVAARLAVFHTGGGDCSRLPVLEARGVAAAAVDGATARIGDARSLWAGGILIAVNGVAQRAGIAPGTSVQGAARVLMQ